MQYKPGEVPNELVPLPEACAAVYQVFHDSQVHGLTGEALLEARDRIARSIAELVPVYRREGERLRCVDGELVRADLPDCVLRRKDLVAALERMLGANHL